MVELSPSHHTLDKVDDIIQSEAMWKDFTKVAGKCLHCVGTKQLGTLRLVDVTWAYQCSQPAAVTNNQTVVWDPSALIAPLLTLGGDPKENKNGDTKPSRYLVAKGLPTVPMRPSRLDWSMLIWRNFCQPYSLFAWQSRESQHYHCR